MTADEQRALAQRTFFTAVRDGRLAALVTVLDGAHVGEKLLLHADGTVVGTLGSAMLDLAVQRLAADQLHRRQCERLTVTVDDATCDLFIDVHTPPLRLIVVGAVHIAIPLVTFANALDFQTIVIDNRTAFATRQRFGHCHELITRWPADALADLQLDEGCSVVFLTHDAKIDNPALAVALHSPAAYIGALGSRRTHSRRLDALRRDAGLSDAQLARIHAPIGLDLGGHTPAEIALAIMAEIVAVRHAGAVKSEK